MRKHIVIKANKFKPKANIKIDYKTLVFFTFLTAGIIIGVFISKKGSSTWHLFFTELLNKYVSVESNENILLSFSRIFIPFFIIFLITYIIGLCGVGSPFLLSVPLMLGCFFGTTITQYYINYGLSGVACCALIYLPSYATATATLIKCCCRAFDISGEIFFYLISGKGENKLLFKDYSIHFLVLLLPIIIACVASVVLYALFSHLFEFII